MAITLPTQIAMITGDSSPQAFEIAQRLARREVAVCLIGREPEALRRLLDGLTDTAAPLYSMCADSGDLGDVRRIRRFIDEQQLTLKWHIHVGNSDGGLIREVFGDQLRDNRGVMCHVVGEVDLGSP